MQPYANRLRIIDWRRIQRNKLPLRSALIGCHQLRALIADPCGDYFKPWAMRHDHAKDMGQIERQGRHLHAIPWLPPCGWIPDQRRRQRIAKSVERLTCWRADFERGVMRGRVIAYAN